MAIGHSSTAWNGQGLSPDGGLLAALDPRLKCLLALAFAMLATVIASTLVKAVMVCVGLAFCVMAGIPRSKLFRRLLALEGFMLMMVVLLPFTVPGPALFELGSLRASWAGVQQGLNILLTATAVVCGLMAFVGSLPANVLGQSLAALGVPERLVALLMLTVRYLDVVGAEYRRMRNSMRARAFVPRSNLHTWRSVGYLVGMGLLRAIDRAERITNAMRCRGFDGRYPVLYPFNWRGLDTVVATCALIIFIGAAVWAMR